MSTRPNLFVIGAMKSGTTSLHEYLGAHPDVFMSEPKEPGYFVDELNWSRGEQWYLSLFAGGAGRAYRGESSTHYTKRPTYEGVAPRIAEFSPGARIVYVMRDPVSRAVSHYWHNVNALMYEAERLDPPVAVRRNPEYVAYSDYAYQLEPYFAAFGPERIFALTFEALVADPAGVVNAICTWLGIPSLTDGPRLRQALNVRPPTVRRVRLFGVPNRIRRSGWWNRVAYLVPKRVRRGLSAFAEISVDPAEANMVEAREYLREMLTPRVRRLESLLGRSFPEWDSTRVQVEAPQ